MLYRSSQDFLNACKSNTFNILFVGNSITLHGLASYWWSNHRGMAASKDSEDYVNIVLEKCKNTCNRKIISGVLNFSQWEMMEYDREESLPILNSFLEKGELLDAVVLQLGENVHRLTDYEKDYENLLKYIKKRTKNALHIVIGDFWEHPIGNKIKREAAIRNGMSFVDLSPIWNDPSYYAGMGTEIKCDDGIIRKIDHEGVARHPGKKGMEYIANGIMGEIADSVKMGKRRKPEAVASLGRVFKDQSRIDREKRHIEARIREIQEKVSGRKLYIWGTGRGGAIVADELEEAGFQISGILQSKTSGDESFKGYKVSECKDIDPGSCFVVVAVMNYYPEIINVLRSAGFCEEDLCFFFEQWIVNTEDISYKGCHVGKYTYGYEDLLEQHPLADSIGRYCSINKTARIWNNHSLDCVTTSPILDHPALNQWKDYPERRLLAEKYGGHRNNCATLLEGDRSALRANYPVTIGNDVWIGANVIILPGIHINDGAVLAAGTVVTKDVPAYAIVGGVPAHVIRYRFTPEEIEMLEKIQWWNWSDTELQKNLELLYSPKLLFAWYKRHANEDNNSL